MIVQMNEYIKNLRTPIAVVGMGKSGEAAKRLLLTAGIQASDILTFDSKISSAQFQDSDELKKFHPKTLVVSPGVPLSTNWIQALKSQGVTITSEINLACSFLTSEKLVGVTGSVGKSTTVSILGAGVQAFSPSAFVGGNLGTPFSIYAVDVLEGKRVKADWIILELSSYQLENSSELRLDFSALTYFTSNHLERYKNLHDYYETKWKIVDQTKQSVFLNSEGADLTSFYKNKSQSSRIQIVSSADSKLSSLNLKECALIGAHNQDNLAMAASIALTAQWPAISIAAMKEFGGLSHRLENLGLINGIRFINDSKATAMDSVVIAARAVTDSRTNSDRVLHLLGGRNKSLPWEDLIPLKNSSNVEFVFFGECREMAQNKSELPGRSFPTLDEALSYVLSEAKTNDTVLLSPGGTSLDEFKSFEDRGDFFKRRIQEYYKK